MGLQPVWLWGQWRRQQRLPRTWLREEALCGGWGRVTGNSHPLDVRRLAATRAHLYMHRWALGTVSSRCSFSLGPFEGKRGKRRPGLSTKSFGVFGTLKPLETSRGQDWEARLSCPVPSRCPASAAQNHTLPKGGLAGKLCAAQISSFPETHGKDKYATSPSPFNCSPFSRCSQRQPSSQWPRH